MGDAMTTTQTPLELWVEARAGAPAVNPVIAALLRHLIATGTPVTVRVPELEPLGQARGPRPDLVLLKTAATLSLSLALAEEAAGGSFLNPAAATSAANDKAAVLARLCRAGLPVPASYLIDPDGHDGTRPGVHGSLDRPATEATDVRRGWVSKPVLGWHGTGVLFHETLADALAPQATAPPAPGWLVDDGTRLVQRRVGTAEPDLKVYVAGDQMFAATKEFSSASFASDDVVPATLDIAQRDIVRAAGETMGLRLFGVDLRSDDGSPVVIDVNPFPGYRGFPDAVPALLAEIDRARRDLR